MRFRLISDNTDTIVGMRLAGISGVMVKTKEEAEKALMEAVKIEDVAIVLITEKVADLCEQLVYELKMKCHKPLIAIIPDSKSNGRRKDSITKYVRDAIGVKI